jgi:hypothetical protein
MRRTQTNRLPLDPEFEPTFCGFRCSTFQSLDMSLMPILRSSKIICIENHKKSGTVSTEASVSMMVKLPMIQWWWLSLFLLIFNGHILIFASQILTLWWWHGNCWWSYPSLDASHPEGINVHWFSWKRILLRSNLLKF